jgi:hypothetical protein
MDVYDIMRWMRHSSVDMTQAYIREFPGYVREMARRYAEATSSDPHALLRSTQSSASAGFRPDVQ